MCLDLRRKSDRLMEEAVRDLECGCYNKAVSAAYFSVRMLAEHMMPGLRTSKDDKIANALKRMLSREWERTKLRESDSSSHPSLRLEKGRITGLSCSRRTKLGSSWKWPWRSGTCSNHWVGATDPSTFGAGCGGPCDSGPGRVVNLILLALHVTRCKHVIEW